VKILEKLRAAGVRMSQARQKALPRPLEGRTIVVTGTLKTYSRSEIEELIRKLGGTASSSVSKHTDFLVCGDEAGSKLEKAKALGVKILTEEEFRKMVA
jgi:DNA ligase (NAD+)